MRLVTSGDVQYINAYYTSGRIALCGDRRTVGKSDPVFHLYQDSVNQEMVLKIVEVIPEAMYKWPKERLDIYILKPGADILMAGFNSLTAEITKAITLDRGSRDPKDSRFKYDATGLPLRIDAVEGWIKLSKVRASFTEKTLSINCERLTAEDDQPKMNIDVETVGSTRLHLGIEAIWVTSTVVDEISNITINIPWTEFAHLLGGLRNALPKIK